VEREWEFLRRTEDEVVDEIGNDDLELCLLDRVEADD